MRIGNSQSASYRLVMQRRAGRKKKAIERLCLRLDKLVERAENCGALTQSRKMFLFRADKVREKLRRIDH